MENRKSNTEEKTKKGETLKEEIIDGNLKKNREGKRNSK